MYDVLTVADAILKIAKRRGMELTPMQLVKLTYIAHGWSLAVLGRPLFNNHVEAWRYGPVIPDLYHATKSYGRSPIPFAVIGDSPIGVSQQEQQFLGEVLDRYASFDGIALSYLTHKDGTPWQQVYQPSMNYIIPNDLIHRHYQELMNGQR